MQLITLIDAKNKALPNIRAKHLRKHLRSPLSRWQTFMLESSHNFCQAFGLQIYSSAL